MPGPPVHTPRRTLSRRWSVYVVRRRDGALYTGIAIDVRRRIAEHEGKSGRGAKSLRGRGPLHLVFRRTVGSRSLALKVEGAIKKLPKERKEDLIARKIRVDRLIRLARRRRRKPVRAASARGARPRMAGGWMVRRAMEQSES